MRRSPTQRGQAAGQAYRHRPPMSTPASLHPPLEPVDGINHCLGSRHPEAVLFSNHIMEEFGGIDAVRRDFGGYLMEYAQFLDLHLERAREVKFVDDAPAERRRTLRPNARRAAWDSPAVMELLLDTSLSCSQVAARLGVTKSAVQDRRAPLGVAHVKSIPRRVYSEEEMTVLRDVTLTSKEVAERLGMVPGFVRKVRSNLGITAPRNVLARRPKT